MLTLDQLKKQGRALANRRFLCGGGEETVDHLLVHCPKARTMWELLLAIFGLVGFSLSLLGRLSFLSKVPSLLKDIRRLRWQPSFAFSGNLARKEYACFRPGGYIY